MQRALLPFLAVLSIAAGCVEDPFDAASDTGANAPSTLLGRAEIDALLSQPVFEEVVREDAIVEGAGGTSLWVDVYRPGDAPEPVPVILVFTPYQSLYDAVNLAFGALGGDGSCVGTPPQECPADVELTNFFVPRGYAVAFADVRGNHNSGGCIDQTGPDQWQDGYNVVEWLASREWSNGKVGMYGISYDGESQIGTALLNPPHLVTIVPAASVSNQYEYSFYDGVAYNQGALGTVAVYAGISLLPGTDPNAVTTYPERFLCQPENVRAGVDFSGDWTPYWDARDYRKLAPGINASVLQIHGLQDWNVKPNHVDGFWNELTTEKRLILGQWGHAYPDREDWELVRHRWFDHYLKGIDTGILADLPLVLVEDDTGEWRGIASFPPLDASDLALHATSSGALAPAPGEEASLVVHDVPGRSNAVGASFSPIPETAGHALTGHEAALAFETEPLTEDLHYSGRPVVHLVAETAAESTRWVVHLVEVDGAGAERIVNRGYLNTRHRDDLSDPKDLPPGERYEVTVRMFPQDTVVEAGNRLRLVITNADGWTQQDRTFAASTVHLGPEGTRLVIPLAPVGTPVPEDALRRGLE